MPESSLQLSDKDCGLFEYAKCDKPINKKTEDTPKTPCGALASSKRKAKT
jgi:hypothetical protein